MSASCGTTALTTAILLIAAHPCRSRCFPPQPLDTVSAAVMVTKRRTGRPCFMAPSKCNIMVIVDYRCFVKEINGVFLGYAVFFCFARSSALPRKDKPSGRVLRLHLQG